MMSDFYKKATLPFMRKLEDDLYKKFADAGRA
jgi:hypothetical protein